MAAGRIPTTANSPLTTKGDLFSFSTAPARLAVGSDGDTIVADSSTSTGLKYAPSFGSTISVQRATSNQTITAGSWTKIQINSEDVDTDSSFDPTTNFRFTPKVAGYYTVDTIIYCGGNAATSSLALYKNNAFFALLDEFTAAGPQGKSTIVSANGTTDNFEWYLFSNTNSTNVQNRSGGSPTTATWLRGL